MASPTHPAPGTPTRAVDALSPEEMAQLEQVLRHVMENDNNVRLQAEAIFAQIKETQPAKLCLGLLDFASRAADLQIQTLAAVLLRRILSGKDSIWDKIAVVHDSLKNALISALQSVEVASARKKIGDVISMLGTKIIPNGGWPELLPTLFQMATAESPVHREASLEVFGEIVQSAEIVKHVLGHSEMIGNLFNRNLNPSNPLEVRVAAMRAATAYVVQANRKDIRNAFRGFAPLMIDTFNAAIKAQEGPTIDETIEMFIELADNQPLFFKNCAKSVFDTIFYMAKSCDWLVDNTRYLALEFLLSLIENAANMTKKVAEYIPSCVQLAVEWTTVEEEEDLAEWNSQSDDSSSPLEVTFCAVGADALDRLSVKLGGEVVLPVIANVITEMLSHKQWNVRNGALTVLCHIAEGCKNEMFEQLEPIVAAVVQRLGDPHPRVRHGACVCIAQFGLDFMPFFQEAFHSSIFPPLNLLLREDVQNPRVVAHAAGAVVNMVRVMDMELLEPYVEQLLGSLAQLLRSEQRIVLQHSITAVAAMSIPLGTSFAPYYEQFMPYITHIIRNANGKDLRTIRGKAMECASFLGLAVGPERFAADAKTIMDLLVSVHSASNDSAEDDLNFSYLHKAYTRILQLMGAEFAPYLPVVMPGLLKSAQIEPDVGIFSSGDVNPEELEGWDVYNAHGQLVAIHTSALEEKATACQMLFVYVKQLEDGILPWIGQMIDVLVPLLKFVYHAEVRSSVLVTLPELVRCVAIAEKKGTVPAGGAANMLNSLLPKVLESIEAESNTGVLYDGLESLKEFVEVCVDTFMTPEQVNQITQQTLHVIVKMANEMVKRDAEEHDEEADDLLGGADSASDDEDIGEEDVLTQSQIVFGALVKHLKAKYFTLYETSIAPSLEQMSTKNGPLECQWINICNMDDLIEFAAPDSNKYIPIFMPRLIEFSMHESAMLRQAAVYGLGVAAEFGGDAMGPYVENAVGALMSTIQNPESRVKYEQPTDNAICALGKFAQFRGISSMEVVMTLWYNYLPLKSDEVEWRHVLVQLCHFVENENPYVIGQNGSNIPNITVLLANGLTQEFKEEHEEEKKMWLNHERNVVLSTLGALNTSPKYTAAFQQGWAMLSPQQQGFVGEQQRQNQKLKDGKQGNVAAAAHQLEQ